MPENITPTLHVALLCSLGGRAVVREVAGGQISRAYADVALMYVDLIGPSEFENNIRQFFSRGSAIVE
jgi:hypothetical protein